MRKISSFMRNMYRVVMVKPTGKRMMVNYSEAITSAENDIVSEAFLKKIITTDDCCMEADPELQKMLELRVAKNGPARALSSNSIFEIFLPLFSLKHIELKMAFISLVMVIALGFGPTYNHSVNKSFNPFFLADTLRDSSVLHMPFVYDSAFKIQYK